MVVRGYRWVFVWIYLSMSACAARYQLADADIIHARDQGGIEKLFVYPSNRTIVVYDRPTPKRTRIGREIDERSASDRLKKPLTINTPGIIVGEDLVNGARRLYVSFDPSCSQPECAYRFVQTENGRYRLAEVPVRAGYAPPRVYRDCILPRRKMKTGHMRSLTEANEVYRLRRRKRSLTVILEVKIRKQKWIRRKIEKERGRPDG